MTRTHLTWFEHMFLRFRTDLRKENANYRSDLVHVKLVHLGKISEFHVMNGAHRIHIFTVVAHYCALFLA